MVSHTHTHYSSCAMHLSQYSCIYWVIPRAFSWGTQHPLSLSLSQSVLKSLPPRGTFYHLSPLLSSLLSFYCSHSERRNEEVHHYSQIQGIDQCRLRSFPQELLSSADQRSLSVRCRWRPPHWPSVWRCWNGALLCPAHEQSPVQVCK